MQELILNLSDDLKKAQKEASLLLNESAAGMAGLMSTDTLLGTIHQYNMWKAAFIATYQLFKTASDESLNPSEMTPSGDFSALYPEPNMIDILEQYFTTDKTTTIDYDIEMGLWAGKADIAKSMLKLADIQEGSILEFAHKHANIVLGVEACKEAIEQADDEVMSFRNTSLITSIGLLLLQSPKILNEDDLTDIIDEIDVKLDALRDLLSALGGIPYYADGEIDQLLGEYKDMGMDDYIENILTGRIFGLGNDASHAAALVNLAVMAGGLLAPCFELLNGSKENMQAFHGTYAQSLEDAGKVITQLANGITSMTRVVARVILSKALKLMGISECVVDMLFGLKMQVLELQRDAERAISGMQVTGVMSAASPSECPVLNLVNVNTAKAIAEAAIKNAALMPFLALANQIIKPLLESITDLATDLKSYQDMIGEALAQAYQMISVQRWVDYVLMYQLNKMRELVYIQLRHYQELKQIFTELRRKITEKDRKLDIINRAFQAYIAKLVRVSEEHDAIVATNRRAYNKLADGIRILQSIIRLLSKRNPTDDDKVDLLSAIQNYDQIRAEEESRRLAIRDSYKNLEGLWKEFTKMRADDFIGWSYYELLDTFKVYSRIAKIVFGLDLNAKINRLQEKIEDQIGPLPSDVAAGQ